MFLSFFVALLQRLLPSFDVHSCFMESFWHVVSILFCFFAPLFLGALTLSTCHFVFACVQRRRRRGCSLTGVVQISGFLSYLCFFNPFDKDELLWSMVFRHRKMFSSSFSLDALGTWKAIFAPPCIPNPDVTDGVFFVVSRPLQVPNRPSPVQASTHPSVHIININPCASEEENYWRLCSCKKKRGRRCKQPC